MARRLNVYVIILGLTSSLCMFPSSQHRALRSAPRVTSCANTGLFAIHKKLTWHSPHLDTPDLLLQVHVMTPQRHVPNLFTMPGSALAPASFSARPMMLTPTTGFGNFYDLLVLPRSTPCDHRTNPKRIIAQRKRDKVTA